MNVFRSEGHIGRWLGSRVPGATLSVTKLCELAHAWWGDRIDPNWQPRTRGQNQAILIGLGLTDAFWNLSGADPDR
ncbi:MAG: alkylmercury lyase [Acidimicrobiaceae bacterium]|nr:MAG: alkylmercury lyase [Acidimicrobiaceae bacterium]